MNGGGGAGGGCGWCSRYFLSSGLYYFIIWDILFYCNGYLYILRELKNLVITFILFKNTHKLINQQLKNGVKIVNWKKKVSYFFYCQKYPYLKLKNEVKIVNWQK